MPRQVAEDVQSRTWPQTVRHRLQDRLRDALRQSTSPPSERRAHQRRGLRRSRRGGAGPAHAEDPVRRRGGIVRLMPFGHASELEQGALNTVTKCCDRLGKAHGRPSPVGERQRDYAEHVNERLSHDRDGELGSPREVGLSCLAGSVELREHDVLVGTVLGTPGLHATLERPQLPFLISTGVLLEQQLEQRLRLERRRFGQHRLEVRPVLEKRILVRPPTTRREALRRQLAALHVLARGLPIHARPHRREANTTVLRHLFHQLPYLRVRRLHRRIVRCREPCRRPIGAPQDGAM